MDENAARATVSKKAATVPDPHPKPGRTVQKKGAETGVSASTDKNWRQPTLAESIKPLPSARLCLTAVFGMGTGRSTAS